MYVCMYVWLREVDIRLVIVGLGSIVEHHRDVGIVVKTVIVK